MFRFVFTRLIHISRVSIGQRQSIISFRPLSTETKSKLGQIDGTARMGIQFRCKICDHTLQKTFTRQSYENGVVIIRCDSCENLHLIADNLGWFKDLTKDGKLK
jgi:hypothetical protein